MRDLSELVLVEVSGKEVAEFRQHADDAKWLMRNYDGLRKTYAGEYVAAYRQQIVDHDRDLVRLRDRVGGTPAVIQYVYKEKPELIL